MRGLAVVRDDRAWSAVIGLTPLPDKPMTSTLLDDDAVVRLVDAQDQCC
jgi:hypothetical protein